jgi:hypothetical protein
MAENIYSLEQFQTKIKDIARPYHFICKFRDGCFNGLGGDKDNMVTASIRTAALPGVTITEVPISYFGMTYKIAGSPTYEPLQCQFIIDADYKVQKMWRDVLDRVYRYAYNEGPYWSAPNSYMGTMELYQMDTGRWYDRDGAEPTQQIQRAEKATPAYTMYMAYLSAIGPVQYGQETKDSPLTFDATITYSYYIPQSKSTAEG